ncbi:GNAT family N-acetyltransferase [Gilliamella apicola]|nr:GNAT family N-acetyltransferase [Gilliamella apicola]
MKKVNANYCISLPLIEDLLNDERNAELYFAYYNGKIVSGSIILKSKNNIFYWINASDSVSLKFKPNHKVLSHIITKYSDIDYINLGGSHSDTLRQFKKTWVAKDFKYYVFEKAF